jgi:hypothetical protein
MRLCCCSASGAATPLAKEVCAALPGFGGELWQGRDHTSGRRQASPLAGFTTIMCAYGTR